MEAFQIRFGDIGNELFRALDRFSLDLVGLISSYLLYGIPKSNTQPIKLFQLDLNAQPYTDQKKTRASYVSSLAYHPIDHRLWVGDNVGNLNIFDTDGKFLYSKSKLDSAIIEIQFKPNGKAYVCSRDGMVAACQRNGNTHKTYRLINKGLVLAFTLKEPGQFLFSVNSRYDDGGDRLFLFNESSQVLGNFGNIEKADGVIKMIFYRESLFTINLFHSNIKIYDLKGQFISNFDQGFFDDFKYTDDSPTDLAIDSFGNVFAITFTELFIFKSDGTFICGIPLKTPYNARSICVDPYNRIYVGTENYDVQVYAFQ